MREWIQINRKNSEEFLQDQDIFKTSIDFVRSLIKTNTPKRIKKKTKAKKTKSL